MFINIKTLAICVMICLPLVDCQRPSYAGSRPPNGHKDKYRPTKNPETFQLSNRFSENNLENGATQRPPQGVIVVNAEPAFVPIQNNPSVQTSSVSKDTSNKTNPDRSPTDISNRNGSNGGSNQGSTETSRLPLDAHGDQQLIDHLSRLPIDNQPFWFINYQAIEAHRNGSGNQFGPIASRSSFLGK
ncbi:uncharacterized protein LOC129942954 [Eupeodes corollae]|uniref:uncharacterized protein LOC129942954 n=1 Tax=Eupeodes corollae TaxID=290404 RepID=UPI00248FD406|nr:uncharacterized protein LOC129942954 [Eupeodes corollae]